MEEEDNIIFDGQNENEDVDNNSIDFSDEEIDDAASFEPSNSNQSNELELITERLKEKNEMKSTSLNDDDLGKSNSTSSQADYSDTNSEEDSPIELETLFDDKNSGHPTFMGASPSQDQAFQDFKSYLNYHCNIRSYDIPHTHDLVNSSGDYDRYYISKLETWVRKMHAEGKFSSHDEDELFKYLRRMK